VAPGRTSIPEHEGSDDVASVAEDVDESRVGEDCVEERNAKHVLGVFLDEHIAGRCGDGIFDPPPGFVPGRIGGVFGQQSVVVVLRERCIPQVARLEEVGHPRVGCDGLAQNRRARASAPDDEIGTLDG
jgi:hypothetical protein